MEQVEAVVAMFALVVIGGDSGGGGDSDSDVLNFLLCCCCCWVLLLLLYVCFSLSRTKLVFSKTKSDPDLRSKRSSIG